MDLTKIKKLLTIVAESEIAEVEIEEEGLKVVVRKTAPTVTMQQTPAFPPYHLGYYAMPPGPPMPQPQPTDVAAAAQPTPTTPAGPAAPIPAETAPAPGEPEGQVIRAPIVGTLFRAPSPDSDPFVSVGDRVQPGDVLCIIEAMKLMNEIECETSGVVRKILAENAEPVEYDQPLFIIDPD